MGIFIRRVIPIFFVLSLTATACYRSESQEFEISIPEQAQTSVVVSADGTYITSLVAPENRSIRREIEEIPEMVRNAVIAIEDERFYSHDGIDLRGIIRAARTNLEAGGISQGASTITQQYVKLAIIENSERTASRKLEEIWYSMRLEDQYSKDFILLQYLNTIYFGHGAYGIKAAALTYFNKDVQDLSIAEAAMLAGIIQRPSYYDPLLNYSNSLRRSHMVLNRMLANEFISDEEYEIALDTPPVLEEYSARLDTVYEAGHFVEEVRRWFLENEDIADTRAEREALLFEGGLRIETTIDLALQSEAEAAVERHLPGGIGLPDASVIVMDPQTGFVLAMVGGRDFFAEDEDAKVNLAVGNGRQVGSSMKPVGLAAALEAGWSATAVYSAPNETEFDIPGATDEFATWKVSGGATGYRLPDPDPVTGEIPDPENVTLIEAMWGSYNTVYAQLVMGIGPERLVSMARRLGIQSPIENVYSSILGTSDSTMLDMASAYSTFANRGVSVPHTYVQRITRADGTTLWEWEREQTRVLSASLADQMTWILQGVIENGTGWRADFGRVAAGKTGTTQNYADAVFVGYTPQITTAVWVGYPDAQISMVPPLTDRKVSGGTFPALIWHDVMESAHLNLPTVDFTEPPPSLPPTTTEEPEVIVATPELLGLTLEEATQFLIDSETGITILAAIEIETTDYDPNVVIGQSPTIGSTMPEGGSMVLEIAVPPPPVVVSDLLTLTIEQAQTSLESSGLALISVIASDPDNPEAPAGIVWSQDPLPGVELPVGSSVTVQVTPEPEEESEEEPEEE
ncbi:MAG: transglycosylase domain-containing protein [Actinomycetota bacterium]|nr:transglycosylase domain-containing protein [Actinomycetota bacterium]